MRRVVAITSWIVFILVAAAAQADAAPMPQGSTTEPARASGLSAILGTAFSYQGRLLDGGSPASGVYDLEFALYDAATDGALLSTVVKPDVSVSNGLFHVALDFGSGTFNGEARWLEIGVRPGDDTGPFTTLTPRQELLPTPYALAVPGLSVQPNATSPNLIGGFPGNEVTEGVTGATISGGGDAAAPNRVTDDYGTIGGGGDNQAGDGAGDSSDTDYATVGGGFGNDASGSLSTVGGGSGNNADGFGSIVGGGILNQASGDTSTVGGGTGNNAGGLLATVPGGQANLALGDYSLAAGRRARAVNQGAFVWADSTDAVFSSTGADQFLIRAAGGVGIGTNSPDHQLHVLANIDGPVATFENTATSGTPDVLILKTGTTGDPTDATNFVSFVDGDGNFIGAIDGNGSGGVTYRSGSGDFAEWLPRLHADELMQPGDIVGVHGGKIARATGGADQVQVVSTAPIVLGNTPDDDEQSLYEKVAFLGQAPVKVRGPVAAGDYIVPSGRNDGTGVAVSPQTLTPAQAAQLVGVAWQDAPAPGVKVVTVAVGLPSSKVWSDLIQATDGRIADLEAQVTALQQQNGELTGRLMALEQRIDAQAVAGQRAGWPNFSWLLGGLVVAGLALVQQSRKQR